MELTAINCKIPDNYEDMNSEMTIFCPLCGMMNTIGIDWDRNNTVMIFCVGCGKEI